MANNIIWENVEIQIAEPIKKKFLFETFDENGYPQFTLNQELFDIYAEQATGLIQLYVPCFDGTQSKLLGFWSAIFNWQNVQSANEKNVNGYAQIERSYLDAIAWLSSTEGTNFCSSNQTPTPTINNIMKFSCRNRNRDCCKNYYF